MPTNLPLAISQADYEDTRIKLEQRAQQLRDYLVGTRGYDESIATAAVGDIGGRICYAANRRMTVEDEPEIPSTAHWCAEHQLIEYGPHGKAPRPPPTPAPLHLDGLACAVVSGVVWLTTDEGCAGLTGEQLDAVAAWWMEGK